MKGKQTKTLINFSSVPVIFNIRRSFFLLALENFALIAGLIYAAIHFYLIKFGHVSFLKIFLFSLSFISGLFVFFSCTVINVCIING
jgi:hypothetical protein